MLDNILPPKIAKSLNCLSLKNLQELRIRNMKPVTICYNSEYYFLGKDGIVNNYGDAIILDEKELENIVLKASNFSLYAANDNIKNGYITLENGIRIGIVGQVVSENGQIITVKNFSSINIRFAHEIKGIGEEIVKYLFDHQDFLNTLIVSPPGVGKTTLLRDLIRILCDNYAKNTLVIDERNELSATKNGISQLELGKFSDIYVDCCKIIGIKNGIRSMNPEIIAVDELGNSEDYSVIDYASTCGVKILATIHAKNIVELKRKKVFENFVKNQTFNRYIVLSNKKGKGTIEKVYNQDFEVIFGDEL